MSLLDRLFNRNRPREAMIPLYRRIVEHGRDPQWYTQGGVPDTKDGRFDMIAAILALVLLRLEGDGEAYAAQSALLAELFVEDMDGQLRELGIGDIVVGKHIGKMMGALGGRLAAYRSGFSPDGDTHDALARNLYRGEPPGDSELAYTASRLDSFGTDLAAEPAEAIIAGKLPDLR
ncbi:ubiquinol-cytochrome C chaperone [Parasphingopyxis algicola]|uniref:ubiquinol-cytochrome C chaperone family protein n=1 Tax=Parasphingopyxis algicola TaxID=2026624 RepID=UPI0015A321E0|nr:ubiquinol-cytochrome C chaperone family protein [Parasphingopyxis algicola]QLC25582.1 ubiquinol-cytochrome C chaperone [Parasphingopyxis algicola]